MDKGILKRLDALQEIVDRGKPCKVVVTFTDGRSTTTDPIGAWAICCDHTLTDDIVGFVADRPEYDGITGVMTVLCHPAPDRRIEDFESPHVDAL